MKFITNIKNISRDKTIRLFINLKTKDFIINIKENGYKTIYWLDECSFKDTDIFKISFAEQIGVHAFFKINQVELKKIRESLSDIDIDFLNHNLKDLSININNENFMEEAVQIIKQ